jgi:hypothetical protein
VDEGVWAVDGRYVLPNGSIHGYLAILEATFTVPPLTNSGGTLGIFMRRPSGPNTVLLLAKRAVSSVLHRPAWDPHQPSLSHWRR